VFYNKINSINSKWCVSRRSRNEHKVIHNGSYKNEETAAHASYTLARKLMQNGEQNHKLNFPYDDIDVFPEKRSSSKYFGVSYNRVIEKWSANRWSKCDKRLICNGYYDTEETAARASDTLGKKLIEIGEKDHKLNFPDDDIGVWSEAVIVSEYKNKKRKRSEDLENSQESKLKEIQM
jgi:hypothetical protein